MTRAGILDGFLSEIEARELGSVKTPEGRTLQLFQAAGHLFVVLRYQRLDDLLEGFEIFLPAAPAAEAKLADTFAAVRAYLARDDDIPF